MKERGYERFYVFFFYCLYLFVVYSLPFFVFSICFFNNNNNVVPAWELGHHGLVHSTAHTGLA